MVARFGNCAYSFVNEKGKPVFAPSDRGREIGYELKEELERISDLPQFYYHLRRGTHVRALRQLRQKRYFARLDFANFFYTVGRNRVQRALRELGMARSEYYAKWSTVKNPFSTPSYTLPYGFVQSPILASVVLATSAVGDYLGELSQEMVVSVYVDDIAIASNNKRMIEQRYNKLRRLVVASNFVINEEKSASPGRTVDLFNCHLRHMHTIVTEERRNRFNSVPRSDYSRAAFEEYCAAVEQGNKAQV